jgi:hypothetical protein
VSSDAAVEQARRVVGLYGDPTISWSIGLQAELAEPVTTAALTERLGAVVAEFPHLGASPDVHSIEADQLDETTTRFLDDQYGDRDPLLRLATTVDGRQLVIAAHHGAVDGLGLLAVVGRLVDASVGSDSRGIGARRSSQAFVASSMRRLGEAVFAPPSRFAPEVVTSSSATAGDVVGVRHLAVTKADTGLVTAAACQAMRDWNAAHGQPTRRIVVAVGASRRMAAPTPDRDTAYLRIVVDPPGHAGQIGADLASAEPEPDFPVTRGSWNLAPLATRMLRNRLGSSLFVSNLGRLASGGLLRRVAFFPAAAGPRAVAVGVASTEEATTVTVRMARSSFTDSSAERLCEAITDEIQSGRPAQ